MRRDAFISKCGTYRYWLRRIWDDTKPTLLFCMLNPSTADGDVDDPTIRKCIGFATRMGYGAIVVVNLFAYRATNPLALHRNISSKGLGYVIGPDNYGHLRVSFADHDQCVCAWGANVRKVPTNAIDNVLQLMNTWSCEPMALAVMSDNIPWHPLMLPYTDKLIPLPC